MRRFSGISDFGLIRRTLAYFRTLTLAQVVGIAVAMAVLTGALLVGDSVRGSLRKLALRRLGPVTHAMVASQLLDETLPERLRSRVGPQSGVDFVPMLSARGRVAGGGHNASGVQVLAVGGSLDPTRGVAGTSVINGALADALNLGDVRTTLTVSVPTLTDTPREAIMANRGRAEVLASLQARATATARQPGFESLFDLSASQRSPRTMWLPLASLQEAVGQPRRINGILVTGGGEGASFANQLRQVMTLDDYGLVRTPSEGRQHVQLMSREVYLRPLALTAADTAARSRQVPVQHVTVDFASSLTDRRSGLSTRYTTIAGIDRLDNGNELSAEDVVLNQWAADQLKARIGDEIEFTFYARDENGNLVEKKSGQALTDPTRPPWSEDFLRGGSAPPPLAPRRLRVSAIIPMEGLGADRTLAPTFKGMTDVERIADWRPPEGIKIDQSLADEEYWNKHRAAPKAFIALTTARLLWGEPGMLETGIRVPADRADDFFESLRTTLDPAAAGLTFVPVREKQLAAAAGSTDFSGLFIGFSFFLVISALILLSMLVRLSVEQRARQLGLLSSLGFGPGRLRWLLLRETLAAGVPGVLVGMLLATGYTWLMVAGLRTWWIGATGTQHLELHVSAGTLIGGALLTLVLATLTTLWSVGRVLKTQPAALLAGGVAQRSGGRGTVRRRISLAVALAGGGIAAVLVAFGAFRLMPAKGAFMAGGTLLLIAGLAALRRALEPRPRAVVRSVAGLSVRNTAWRPTRSMLTASLIALASYSLVTVGSMRQTAPPDAYAKPSGTGGFALILTADIPLLGDLNTPSGRRILGMRDPQNPLLTRAKFVSLRSWQGQDISCLNMTRPTQPTILEFPEQIEPRFVIQESPYRESFKSLRPFDRRDWSSIGVLADAETAEYILHLAVGQTLALDDQSGRARSLMLAGTLQGSIFQSELLMPPPAFRSMFPYQSGFSTVLIDAPPQDAPALARLLEDELGEFSVTVESTASRLQRYREVANTYLSTFEVLGSLGLLLGTVGVGVALVRAVIERRGELALLGALGFSRRRLATAVFLENALLLTTGLVIGTGAALLAVLPAARGLNASGLAMTFGVILVTGLVVVLIATRIATRTLTPAMLRSL